MAVGATGRQILARVYRSAERHALAGVTSGDYCRVGGVVQPQRVALRDPAVEARTYISHFAMVVTVTAIAAYVAVRRAA